MSTTAEWVDGKVLIPDLLRAAPQARPVLDRYGLRGCGGRLGPVESLEFFARAHDVPIRTLLSELRDAVGKEGAEPEAPPAPADTIYRPFFKAGIAVALTLGAAWGAYLLLRIAFAGSFTAVGIHEVNAHGHAQIFGWVGLFVMGFAYQAFPRFKHAALAWPRAAYASLGLMLAGIVARSVAEPLAELLPWAGSVAVSGAVVEVIAIALFAAVLVATWRASGKALAFYDWYVASALVWFVAQAVYEAVYLAATLAAPDREHLLGLVAAWQGPLRDMQIHGFALLMILGVSQRLLPHFYGLPAPSQGISLAALVALNAAVAGECAGLVLMRAGGHGGAALWYGSVLLLAGAVGLLVWDWRLFTPPTESDRGLKFLRAAYLWLLASLAMLVLVPLYQHVVLAALAPASASARLGFSHPYYGAIRHAITVGFISLMIVGVAAKVVPTLNGVDLRRLSGLWGPFLLLNAGCALRVIGQTATDFTDTAFPFAGVSGLLEVTGLALWGVHLWRIMAGRARVRPAAPADDSVVPGAALTSRHRVGDVLDHYPALLDTFLAFGFKPLANPFFRRTVARFVTIGQACRQQGVDEARLLGALNQARARPADGRLSLRVVEESFCQ